jgi:hypothetical protein
MEFLIIFGLLAMLGFGCVSSNPSIAWPSRLMTLAFILIALSGCASLETSTKRVGEDVEAVVQTIPSAIGTIAGAAIFGGTVSAVPAPDAYLSDSVNREGRIIYNDSRRAVSNAVADAFRPK